MLIGIMGLNGSGKDTAAKYIFEKYGFEWISLSDIIKEELKRRHMDMSNRENINFVSEELRLKEGSDYLMKRILKKYSPENKLVLSSFRHPSEVKLLKKNQGVAITINTNLKIRFKRTVERKKFNPEDHGSTSFEDFKLKEESELSNSDPVKMQMKKTVNLADYFVDNNSSVEDLYEKLDVLMNKIINN